MALTETDFQQLQTYLDGELPTEESEALWRRLADEPALAAELDRLRGERAVRQAAFASLEPAQAAVDRVESRVLRSIRRHRALTLAARSLAMVTVAAACILFGFAVGWLGHERYPSSLPGADAGAASSSVQTVGGISRPAGDQGGKFVVNVRDDSGRVVAVQQFDTLQEAREFADDVSRAQAQHHDPHDVPVVPVSNHF